MKSAKSWIAAAGVPARVISCSIRRMAPVAARNVLTGKITIRYPGSTAGPVSRSPPRSPRPVAERP
jgi:hypothetical protein